MKKNFTFFSARAAMMLLATLLFALTAQTALAQSPFDTYNENHSTGDLTITEADTYTAYGTIEGNLIIGADVTLNVGDLTVRGDIYSENNSNLTINVDDFSNLHAHSFYANTLNMTGGTISADDNVSANAINMTGGKIRANSFNAGGTISGGTIIVQKDFTAGILFYDLLPLTISGGTINVSQTFYIRELTINASTSGLSITADAYDTGGTLSITGGYVTDGTNIYGSEETETLKGCLQGNSGTNLTVAVVYTVTFDRCGGGGGDDNAVVMYGHDMPTINVPTRDGYTFGGYFTATNGEGDQYYNADGTSARTWGMESGATLYAKWTVVPHTVTSEMREWAAGTYNVTSNVTINGDVTITSDVILNINTGCTLTIVNGHIDATHGSLTFNGPGTLSVANEINANTFNMTGGTINANMITVAGSISGGTIETGSLYIASLVIDVTNSHSISIKADNYYWTYGGGCSLTINGTLYAGTTELTGTFNNNNDLSIYNGKYLRTESYSNTYTVTFDKNGGEGTMSPQTFTVGETKALSTCTYTREGFTFDGWATTQGGDVAYTDGQSVSNLASAGGTVTLYAHWRENTAPVTTYTVTFNANGGTGNAMSAQTFTIDETKTLSACTYTRTGYTFDGWATTQNGDVAYTNGQSVSNLTSAGETLTLYAHWTPNTYTVNLDRQEGSGGTESVTATYDAAMPSATMPTRDGYTFGGYFTGTNGEGTKYYNANGSSALTWDMESGATLYAKWTPITYTVTFKANGGQGDQMPNQLFTYDVAQNLNPLGYSRNGYTFDGWATTANGDKVYDDHQEVSNLTTTAGATITLYAKWTPITYTVTSGMSGEWTTGTYNVTSNVTINGLVNITGDVILNINSGCTLKVNDGYFHADQGSLTFNGPGTLSVADDIMANSFNMTGGTINANSIYIAGSISGGTINVANYFEAGKWTIVEGNNHYDDLTISGGTIETSSFAIVSLVIDATNSHSISIKANEYSFDYSGSLTINGTLYAGTTPLTGTLNSGISAYNGMYLRTESYSNTYTVTFNANGGTGNAMSPQTFTVGVAQNLSHCTFTRNDYTFDGWATTQGGNVAYTDGQSVSNLASAGGTITLYAHWTANTAPVSTYIVTFNANGGTGNAMSAQTFTIDESKALFASTYTRIGYTFDGWATTQGGNVAYTDGQNVSNLTSAGETLTLYAHWTPNTYTVNFNRQEGNGGTESVTATYGAAMPSATMPTREGYTFGGYFTGTNGEGTQYYNADGTSAHTWDRTENTTLYAKWTTDIFNIYVSFYPEGGTQPFDIEEELLGLGVKIGNQSLPIYGNSFTGHGSGQKNVPVTLTLTIPSGYLATGATYKYADANQEEQTGNLTPGNNNTWSFTITEQITDVDIFIILSRTLAGGASEASAVTIENDERPHLTGGWYKVNNGVTFNQTVTLHGDTYLMLDDELVINAASGNGIECVGSATLTLSYSSDGGSIMANSYNGTVQIADNRKFKTNDQTPVEVSGTISDNSIINDKTLTPKMYTVTFNTGKDGSEVASQSVAHGLTATKPTNPTRTEYVFNYWKKDDAAYNFSTAVTADLTLTAEWKKQLTNGDITVEIPAQTYNGSMLTPDITVKDQDAVVSDEHYTVTLPEGRTNAGDYTITITAEEGSALYAGSIEARFTINPAGVTLTANSETNTYNGVEQTLTGFTCSVDGLTFTGVTASGSGTNVGPYSVTFSDVTINTTKDDTGNYVVTETIGGTLTINRKAVTITADDDTKTYDGTALTKNTFTTTDLEEGDTHTFDVDMTNGSSITNVGTQSNVIATVDGVAVNPGVETAVGNYLVTTANGTLTVEAKDIATCQVTMPDQTLYDGVYTFYDIGSKFSDYPESIGEEVKDGENTLTRGTHYSFGSVTFASDGASYTARSNSIDDVFNVEIIGEGNYAGKKMVTFTLVGPNGTWGDLSWSLASDGTLSITGTGTMNNGSSYPWINCSDDITAIVIGEGIPNVANSAFEGCGNIVTLSLGSSVTTIEESAFEGCAITTLIIPNNVETIGSEAFADCRNLLTLSLGSGVTIIGSRAFKNCVNLADLSLGSSLTTIEESAFEGCAISTLEITDKVETIGDKAFAFCTNLTVDLDDLLAKNITIGYHAFSNIGCLTGSLDDNADNADKMDLLSQASANDVTLNGRTLYKDGNWNTICLPFSIGDNNAEEGHHYDGTPFEGATVMTLDATTSGFEASTGTLNLNFNTVNSISAGTPYIIKWANGDNVTDPKFNGVEVLSATPTVAQSTDKKVEFRGIYSLTDIFSANNDNLFLGIGKNTQNEDVSMLYYPDGENMTEYNLGAFRAYFHVDLTNGNGVRAINLSFGDEEQPLSISPVGERTEAFSREGRDEVIFTLDGRKLDSQPTKKGMYIVNGRKVVIK